MRVYHSVTELIGHTPLLELRNYAAAHGLTTPILAKLERNNPAGSAKDRVAANMIRRAEEEGRVISACDDLPRSFVVTGHGEKTTVYLSQLSSAALTGRVERNSFE